MFKIIEDLKMLDQEVKAAINHGTYRLLNNADPSKPYALLMGGRVFLLDRQGAFAAEVTGASLATVNFNENLAFVPMQLGALNHQAGFCS